MPESGPSSSARNPQQAQLGPLDARRRTPDLPARIIPTRIRWLKTSGEFPYGHESSTPQN